MHSSEQGTPALETSLMGLESYSTHNAQPRRRWETQNNFTTARSPEGNRRDRDCADRVRKYPCTRQEMHFDDMNPLDIPGEGGRVRLYAVNRAAIWPVLNVLRQLASRSIRHIYPVRRERQPNRDEINQIIMKTNSKAKTQATMTFDARGKRWRVNKNIGSLSAEDLDGIRVRYCIEGGCRWYIAKDILMGLYSYENILATRYIPRAHKRVVWFIDPLWGEQTKTLVLSAIGHTMLLSEWIRNSVVEHLSQRSDEYDYSNGSLYRVSQLDGILDSLTEKILGKTRCLFHLLKPIPVAVAKPQGGPQADGQIQKQNRLIKKLIAKTTIHLWPGARELLLRILNDPLTMPNDWFEYDTIKCLINSSYVDPDLKQSLEKYAKHENFN